MVGEVGVEVAVAIAVAGSGRGLGWPRVETIRTVCKLRRVHYEDVV